MQHTIKHLTAAIEPEREPLTKIPGRLTSSAIRKTLLQCGIELPPEGELQVILASGKTLAAPDIAKIDAALDAAKMPFAERLRFRHALAQDGLIPKGKGYSLPETGPMYPNSFRKFI